MYECVILTRKSRERGERSALAGGLDVVQSLASGEEGVGDSAGRDGDHIRAVRQRVLHLTEERELEHDTLE